MEDISRVSCKITHERTLWKICVYVLPFQQALYMFLVLIRIRLQCNNSYSKKFLRLISLEILMPVFNFLILLHKNLLCFLFHQQILLREKFHYEKPHCDHKVYILGRISEPRTSGCNFFLFISDLSVKCHWKSNHHHADIARLTSKDTYVFLSP
jgi:hypothetical protein